jgi:hypothetical protein
MAEVRRIELRLYVRLARLYLLKVVEQLVSLPIKKAGKIGSFFLDGRTR